MRCLAVAAVTVLDARVVGIEAMLFRFECIASAQNEATTEVVAQWKTGN
jgi:hypothetical protein